jgi:hypothetical protein
VELPVTLQKMKIKPLMEIPETNDSEETIDELARGIMLRKQNAEWFELNRQQLLENGYANKWVAVHNQQVIFSNNSIYQLTDSLKAGGYDSVIDGVVINYLYKDVVKNPSKPSARSSAKR